MKTHPLYRFLPVIGILITACLLTSINRPYGIGPEGDLKFSPSIAAGALAQDKMARQRMNFMATEFSHLAHNFAKTHGCTDTLLSFPSKSSAKNSDCIIVPRSTLRFLDPRRGTSCTSLRFLGGARIFVFDWDSTRDWRQFIAQQYTPLPIEFAELTTDEYRRIEAAKTQCDPRGT